MFDKQLMFSDAQAITTTANSTNVVKITGGTPAFTTDSLGNTPENDVGRSPALDVLVQVITAFTAAGAATLTVSLVADDDAALGSATTIASTAAIGKATLVPGYQFRLALPAGFAAADVHLGLVFTVATGPMTAGAVTAGLIAHHAKHTAPGVFK